MNLDELTQRAKEIKRLYDSENKQNNQDIWDYSDYSQGMVGDVGDLMKLIMAKKGLRKKVNVEEKIKHELSDVLWSVLIIADELGVNMEESFVETMEELEGRFE